MQKPNPKYANTTLLEDSGIRKPSTYEEAVQSREWRDAMKEEIKAIRQNETWELVPPSTGTQPISCKWVYKVKTRLDGSIER